MVTELSPELTALRDSIRQFRPNVSDFQALLSQIRDTPIPDEHRALFIGQLNALLTVIVPDHQRKQLEELRDSLKPHDAI